MQSFLTLPQETSERVVDLPEDDPEIVGKFLSAIYTGNYEDALYGKPKGPSAIALLSTEETELKLRQRFSLGRSKYTDKSDDKVACAAERSGWKNAEKYHTKLLQSLSDSIHVYIMGDKYDAPTPRLLALERLYRNVESILDADTNDELEMNHLLEGLAEGLDEIYSNTTPDRDCCIRAQLASLIKTFNGRDNGTLMRMLDPVICQHEDFAIYLGMDGHKRKAGLYNATVKKRKA
ncbi:hypothetical protein BJ170DRAFT_606567 [Xylariales sp. AK1849]|nr:hypothetical protein BJ170DRAFT_606567 [Xylariales sp. AK1849]